MVPECVPKKADRIDNQRKHKSFQFEKPPRGLFVKLSRGMGQKPRKLSFRAAKKTMLDLLFCLVPHVIPGALEKTWYVFNPNNLEQAQIKAANTISHFFVVL